jgi:hypothetical protein
MDREHRDHEVERPVGQRILEPAHPQVRIRQRLARVREHAFAGVDADELRLGVPGKYALRGLSRARPELENPPRALAGRGGCGLLEPVVARHLRDHQLAVAVGLEMELSHHPVRVARSRSKPG